MCPPCERPPPRHPHLCICSLLYDSVSVVWPLGQKACEMAQLPCYAHSGGCSKPPWKKSLSNSMASLLLALCRLFSSLLLPTAILLVTGLHILHSKYTTIFRKKFSDNIKTTAERNFSNRDQSKKQQRWWKLYLGCRAHMLHPHDT